jgi:energy-coupling factor transporter ATP-binding protein EcfA2
MPDTLPIITDFFVSSIKVEKLFGHFNYDLDFACPSEPGTNRLSILYGDNGSGKTTILKLLFHLLSPVESRGHKTVLVQTKFSLFQVTLANGTRVIAERPKNKISGGLELRIEREGNVQHSMKLQAEADGSVSLGGTPDMPKLRKFLHELKSLNVEILFMRDNRRLASSLDENQHAGDSDLTMQMEMMFEMTPERIIQPKRAQKDTPLFAAVENVTTFFRKQALAASSRGEVDTNKIYDDLIRQLVAPRKQLETESSERFESSMERLESLAERNKSFVKVGLASPLLAADMIKSLKKAKGAARYPLLNVLTPYIDSVQARLDALDGLRNLIFKFTDSLNSFIGNGKSIVFDLRDGLRILGYDKDVLSPTALSSGERQLLSMFCHIICVRGRTAVFIIDEPELSLNVKWQRRLVQSLLDCTAGASVQFVMASHSLELLARHRSHVIPLKMEAKIERAS